MSETIETIARWHSETFKDATLDGQIEKFYEELNEYNEETNLQELADMFIVACGISRFDSVVALEYFDVVFKALLDWKTFGCRVLLQTVIDEKMQKNRKRVWNKTGNGTYHHELGVED